MSVAPQAQSPMSRRAKVIWAVWIYSGAICVLVAGIIYVATRSAFILWPTLAILFGGGLIGTLVARRDKDLDL